jgi:enoyl-CoA hydratase/carnithine racemase
MTYKHISSETDGAFAVVTMRRPEARNALSLEHLRELFDAFRRIGEGDASGVILAAEGPVFSAGHDFSDMANRDLAGMRELLAACTDVMMLIQSLPQPVVAEVQGLATAAGCQLVATCDLAVASEEARFQVPGGKGGWFCTTPGVALVRAVGRKRALEMLLTGDPIDARTALAWGLVNRVVPAERLEKETRALLGRATRGSASSKEIGKRAFYRQADMDVDAAYAYAVEVMAESSQTEDARENLRAFLEKRPPKWGQA